MAIHASPGVYFEILDFSTYAPRLSKTILALVGKAGKGPTTPTFISSVRQFIDTFGVPRKYDYSALAAISYLEFGSALWYSRLIGSKAKKAEVIIPKALEIYNEPIANVNSSGSYIFSGTLNYQPVPGTVEIVITDGTDPTNKVIIQDDESGNFSPYSNLSITNFPNFIDYDTGDFRFTLDSVVANDTISVVYNTKDILRSNEVHATSFSAVLGTDTFTHSREIYSPSRNHANLQAQCCKINIENCLPQPSMDVRFEDILEFKSKRKDELNALSLIDYEKMISGKWKFVKAVFEAHQNEILKDRNFKKFIKVIII